MYFPQTNLKIDTNTMSEKLNGFTIQTTQADHERLALNKISQACGLPKNNINPKEVLYIINGDYSDVSRLHLQKKYLKSNDEAATRSEKEASQTFKQAAELLEAYVKEYGYNSYGLFGPSYEQELKDQQKYFSLKDPYRSLLVGAYTTDTAVEYTATVKNIFPQAETHIIDIEGVDCSNKPGFAFGDALQIPFKNDAFQSIHTNYLLHMLSGENEDGVENVKQLFRESYRALSKNGKIILCEGIFSDILDENSLYTGLIRIRQLLEIAKFRGIEIKNALKYVNRQEMNRHFRSTHGALNERTEEMPFVFLITAIK